MIKPTELESDTGTLTWETILAADTGDVGALRRLLAEHPKLARAEYWYTPVIHFAVREGRAEAVQMLLDAGADPEANGLHDGSLIEMARDRGLEAIARMLEGASAARRRAVAQAVDHPIHAAAARNDAEAVRALLDADPALVHRGNRAGATPLHCAAGGQARDVVLLLLERGADIHTRARGGMYFWADVEAIDVALWGNGWQRREPGLARLLLERGATYDLAVAAALGDIGSVTAMLEAEPDRIRETRPSGRRPLSAAIESGHEAIAHLLLDRGAHPNWDEPTAPDGRALHAAAEAGDRALVERMLSLGANPSSGIDSSGNAVTAAATPEIRALLIAHGGEVDPYDTSWIEDDEELCRVASQASVTLRVEAAFPMVVGGKRRDRLARLFDAGIRVPPVITGCQGYLLGPPDMLRTLLDHGMSPDLRNWQHQTLLHWAANGNLELATMLLDAGADICARDDEYRSTPLAWAARANAVPIVELLLARGAQANCPDDPAWATPLAWATRRGHGQVASILRSHGATR